MCRILNGMWQVSGGHGRIDAKAAVREMSDYVDAGFTTWDLADHYGPAEDFIGEFKRRFAAERGPASLDGVLAFTKWVPQPGKMTRRIVEEAVALSLRRMAVASLDLLQFHWWEYGDPSYLEALSHLAELQAAGKIKRLGLTNFDTERVRRIIERGIPIVSNQVQYSLVDLRPAQQMAPYCQERGIKLLTYGTVCGGLLSEVWLGRPEPGHYELETVSQQKYQQMIEAWGGWPLFQDLLRALKGVADKHRVSIANVGVRYMLDRPAVGGVIVGTRLGIAEHRADNARVFTLSLDAEDVRRIESVCSKGRDLMQSIGDCGDEYR